MSSLLWRRFLRHADPILCLPRYLKKKNMEKISPQRKSNIVITGHIRFTHHLHEIFSYLKKKMNFTFLKKIPAGKFAAWGKIPAGKLKYCGKFSRSLWILSQRVIEFTQYGLFLQKKSHFRFLCLLKVQGDFAKNWFGKKNSGGSLCQRLGTVQTLYLTICILIIILISNTIQRLLSLFDWRLKLVNL